MQRQATATPSGGNAQQSQPAQGRADGSRQPDQARPAAGHGGVPVELLTELVPIGAVEFDLGASMKDDDPAAKPAHTIKLRPFSIERTEVTLDQWRVCHRARACDAAPRSVEPAGPRSAALSRLCQGNLSLPGNTPINCVDHSQAEAYCVWAGRRLPTEAEWEWAAKGATEYRRRWYNWDDDGVNWALTSSWRTFPWGKQPPDGTRLNGCGAECTEQLDKADLTGFLATVRGRDAFASLAPVGSFPAGASAFGVLDLAGNLAEWTADAYAPYPEHLPARDAGARDIAIRGGAWAAWPPAFKGWFDYRVTRRGRKARHARDPRLGFRCAADLDPSQAPAPAKELPPPPRPFVRRVR